MSAEATIFQQIVDELRALRADMKSMAAGIAASNSDWVDPDEACRIIGVPLTASHSHRRRLGKLVETGRLTKFRDGKPRMYHRGQLRQVADLVAQGKINV